MRQVSGSAVTGGCRLALRGARCPPARGVSLLSQLILSMGTRSRTAPGHPNRSGRGLAPPWGHRAAGAMPGSFLHAAARGRAAGRGAVRDPQTNLTSSSREGGRRESRREESQEERQAGETEHWELGRASMLEQWWLEDSGSQPCSHPILDFKLGTGPAWAWGVPSRPQGQQDSWDSCPPPCSAAPTAGAAQQRCQDIYRAPCPSTTTATAGTSTALSSKRPQSQQHGCAWGQRDTAGAPQSPTSMWEGQWL